MMVPAIRGSKCALVLAIGVYYLLVVFNNLTDYNSNYQFVRHVLMMDSTFPGNHGLWRAIFRPWIHTAFYISIIAWETVTGLICWWGGLCLVLALRSPESQWRKAKKIAAVALTLGALQWFLAFTTVGGEWFLMWQSRTWNGQDAAFRMFAVLLLLLIYLTASESEVAVA